MGASPSGQRRSSRLSGSRDHGSHPPRWSPGAARAAVRTEVMTDRGGGQRSEPGGCCCSEGSTTSPVELAPCLLPFFGTFIVLDCKDEPWPHKAHPPALGPFPKRAQLAEQSVHCTRL